MLFNKIETDRLLLRELREDDLPSLKTILCDDETMYAYEGAFDECGAREWLSNQIRRYSEFSFGLWAVVLKTSGEVIGQCGLTYQKYGKSDVVEVGYLFNKAYWHNGYAVEAAAACMRYAFEELGERYVYSIIRDNNAASQKVALRNGMKKVGTEIKVFRNINMLHFVYRAENPKNAE